MGLRMGKRSDTTPPVAYLDVLRWRSDQRNGGPRGRRRASNGAQPARAPPPPGSLGAGVQLRPARVPRRPDLMSTAQPPPPLAPPPPGGGPPAHENWERGRGRAAGPRTGPPAKLSGPLARVAEESPAPVRVFAGPSRPGSRAGTGTAAAAGATPNGRDSPRPAPPRVERLERLVSLESPRSSGDTERGDPGRGDTVAGAL